jgi:site-specific DNA recombinase
MMADAKAGLFTRIVVYKLDRLYRNLRLLLGLKEDLTKANVTLISMRESIDTSNLTGRMTFQVLGMVSEWERESIADRMKSGRLQRYRQGCWASGYAAYGYQYNKDTKKLEIDTSEAVIVKRIYTEYASGKSLNAIANDLNSDNVRPKNKQGMGWRANAVRLTLINPMYKGQQSSPQYAYQLHRQGG